MLAVVQDVNGNPGGIHRTYLDPAGNGQAKVPCPKKLSKPKYPGANKGAAIRLREVIDGVLGIAEGIETAESATQATGIPTWSTLSAGGMRHFAVPKDEVIRKLIIFADNDASGVGQNAAYDLARRLLLEGYEASVVLPANVDTDWNDVLVSEGEEAIRQALAAAKPFDLAFQPLPVKRLPAPTASVAPSAAPSVAPLASSNVDPVTELNRKHFLVPIGGTVCIATETRDPLTGNYLIALGSQSDLSLRYRNWPIGKETAAAVWLGSPERREYKGIVFAPGIEVQGFYNVFRGFSAAPRQGECNLFWDHLSSIICRGNQKHYRYFRKWLAHLFQRPAELPGVAIVILGKQGTGKSIFVDLIGGLLGQHFLSLVQMDQLTGRFCGHLMDLLLVCANEALWGGNKAGEGAIKSMITDPYMAVEFKGKDIIRVANYKRFIVTSNESWPVAMGMDDRRFLVLEASDARKEDKAYFGTLMKQMGAGGLEALMHDLLHEDLTGFDVRTKPESTFGFDIKIRGAEPIARWWYECLYEATIGGSAEFGQGNRWSSTPSRMRTFDSFVAFCATHRLRTMDQPSFGKELRKLMPGCIVGESRIQVVQDTDDTLAALSGPPKRDHCYRLPILEQCRQAFQEYAKSGSDIWPEVEATIPTIE